MSYTLAGRLADLLPVLNSLETFEDIIQRADRFHAALPKELRNLLVGRGEDSFNNELLLAFLSVDHDVLQTNLKLIRGHIETLRALVHAAQDDQEDLTGDTAIMFTNDELKLITGFLNVLARLGSNSRREFSRFLEAVTAGDTAYSIMRSIPAKQAGHQPAKVQVSYAHDLPGETIASLKFASS